jgi:hypothetical protein
MPPFDSSQDADAVEAFHDYADALVEEAGDGFTEAAPEVSGWSPAEHLFHTALATRGMLGLALGLAEQRPTRFGTDLPLNGLGAKMLRAGLRRGGAAPGPTRPPETFDASDLRRALAESRATLDALRPYLATLSEASGRAMHPYFGGLDAVEWVRSARVHAEHHARIIDAVQAAQAA